LSVDEQERVSFSREFRSHRLADSMTGACNNEQRLHRRSFSGNSAAFARHASNQMLAAPPVLDKSRRDDAKHRNPVAEALPHAGDTAVPVCRTEGRIIEFCHTPSRGDRIAANRRGEDRCGERLRREGYPGLRLHR
jgi:hypothetical protein